MPASRVAAAAFAALVAAAGTPLRAAAQGLAATGVGDVSDLIGMSGGGGSSAEDDPDEGLDPGARRKRMRACLAAGRSRIEERSEEMEQAIGSLLTQMATQAAAQGRPPAAEEMAEEQAQSQLLFSMTIACYYAIDGDLAELLHSGGKATKDQVDALFKAFNNPPRPTRRQYRLVESVMKEERDRLMKETAPMDTVGGMNIIGQRMSLRQKVLYTLAVLALVFGAGLWALRRQMREKPARERTAKAARRVMKAEMRLEKKAR